MPECCGGQTTLAIIHRWALDRHGQPDTNRGKF
jgi:hypothetical protein